MNTVDITSAIETSERCVEAYKSLRTNIQFFGTEVKVIGITSTVPNEGKSTVSINLAKELAQNGKEVLFIDCDLRGTVVLKTISSKGKLNGLTNFLVGQCQLKDIVFNTNYKNLDMVFTGPLPPNPAELQGSKQFKKMIDYLSEIYDYIIIDTAPLGVVIDAAVVSKCCDGMVIVVEHDSISYKHINKVKHQLEVADSKILGVVLNKIPLVGSNSAYGRYYGRNYSKYYSGE